MSEIPAIFARVDEMLAHNQMRHHQLGEMVSEYRQIVAEALDEPTDDNVRLARGLPGARYRVHLEHIRQTWMQIEVELKRLFPKDD